MLEIVSVWLYCLFTTCIPGYFFLNKLLSLKDLQSIRRSKAPRPYKIRFFGSYILAGLILVSVYAQFISLFMGVALAANLIWLALCIVLLLYQGKDMYADIVNRFRPVDSSLPLIICILVFLIMAYGTSHGYQHYDTGFYHAQAIRWIETFGSVYGLGNLHTRLAYNSAAFVLSAFYSFSFLGASVHPMAGFCAMLLALECVNLKNMIKRGCPVLSDMVRCAAIYYLFGCFDEIVSPASDTFVLSLSLYLVIKWLDLSALHERSFVPHALLSLAAFFLMTLKLSAIPLVLLTLHPVSRLIRKRKRGSIKPILICAALAVIILMPFILRNIKLSGYLIYPLAFADIFHVDWKIPVDVLKYDAAEIRSWGRGARDASLSDAPLSVWFPVWFDTLPGLSRLLFVFDMAALPLFICLSIGYSVFLLRTRSENRHIREDRDTGIIRQYPGNTTDLSGLIFILAVLYAQLLFWFFTAPLPRYGSVFLWLPFSVITGKALIPVFEKAGRSLPVSAGIIFLSLVLLYSSYRTVNLVREDIPSSGTAYLLKQQPYETFENLQTQVCGVTVYYPAEGDRSGYDDFPATPSYNLGSFTLRGESLKQGFKHLR